MDGAASQPVEQRDSGAAVVSVWIVNYNSTQWLAGALAGLTSDRISSIVVLDNASDPAQRADLLVLAAGRPKLRVLLSEVNLGFGGGHNRIAELTRADAAPGELVWLLNPDTVVDDVAVQALCSVLERGDADVVSPVILTGPRDRPVVWFAGGRIDRRGARVAPALVGRSPDAIPTTPLLPGSFLTGAAMFLSRSTFERLGGFREELFLYWEDVDLCLRAAALGLRLAVATGAVIWHAEGGSSRDTGSHDTGSRNTGSVAGTSATAFYYSARNRILVCAPPAGGLGLVAGRGTPYLMRLAATALLTGGRQRWRKCWAVLRGTVDGVRGRTGDAHR